MRLKKSTRPRVARRLRRLQLAITAQANPAGGQRSGDTRIREHGQVDSAVVGQPRCDATQVLIHVGGVRDHF